MADDRPDWVGVDRFPGAERREVVEAKQLFTAIDPTPYTHVYILGYDAEKDTDVLELACRSFPGRVGLIASTVKRTHMFAELRRRGVDEAALARVRSPVGLADRRPDAGGDRGEHRGRVRAGRERGAEA